MVDGRDVELVIRAKDQTAQAFKTAQAAIEKFNAATAKAAPNRAAIKETLTEIVNLKKAYAQATADATRYAKAMRDNAVAERLSAAEARELRDAFALTRDRAREAKAALLEKRTALETMKRSQFASVKASREVAAAQRETAAAARRAAEEQVRAARRAADAQGRAAAQMVRAARQQGAALQGLQLAARRAQSSFADRELGALTSRQGRGFLGLRPYELTNLSYQVNDVVTGLASGQPVFQVFAQQIGQIAQLFPRVIRAIIAFRGPILAATAAITPFVAAFAQLREQARNVEEFGRSIEATGSATIYNAQNIAALAQELDRLGGSMDDARATIEAFMRAGLAEDRFRQFGVIAQDLARVLGIEIPEAADKLASAFAGGFDEVVRLEQEMDLFSASALEAAIAMVEQGDEAAALNLLLTDLQDRYGALADDARGPWSQAFRDVAAAWNTFLDALANNAVIQGVVALVDQLSTAVAGLVGKIANLVTWLGKANQTVIGGSNATLGGALKAFIWRGPVGVATYLSRSATSAPAPEAADNPQGPITAQTVEDAAKDNALADFEARREQAKADAEAAKEIYGDLARTLDRIDADRAKARQQAIADQEALNRSVADTVAQAEFERGLVGASNTERKVAVALREAELEAQKKGLALTAEQRAQIEASTRALSVAEEAEKARSKAAGGGARARREENTELERQRALEQQLADLTAYRRELMESIRAYDEAGDTTAADGLRERLEGVNAELLTATENMIAFWKSVGGPEAEAAILKLQRTQLEIQTVGEKGVTSGKQINDFLAGGGARAFDQFAKMVVETGDAFESAKIAFLQFASDFLREIAQMIIKQALLNALGAGGGRGGGVGGIFAGLVNGLFRHQGGLVGAGGGYRPVPVSAFIGAQRFHRGGLPGLKPGEVGAILKKGEEVLTEDDPRHVSNGGGMGGGGNTRVVNAIDGTSFLEEALRTREGERLILNFMRANPGAVRGALGV